MPCLVPRLQWADLVRSREMAVTFKEYSADAKDITVEERKAACHHMHLRTSLPTAIESKMKVDPLHTELIHSTHRADSLHTQS